MIAAVKLRNASKYASRPTADESATKERVIDYNIFDELSDEASEDEIPEGATQHVDYTTAAAETHEQQCWLTLPCNSLNSTAQTTELSAY